MRKSFARLSFKRRPTQRGSRCSRPATALLAASVLVTAAGWTTPAAAQVVPGSGAAIGTMGADRARVRQITGRSPDTTASADSARRIRPLYPTIRFKSDYSVSFGLLRAAKEMKDLGTFTFAEEAVSYRDISAMFGE